MASLLRLLHTRAAPEPQGSPELIEANDEKLPRKLAQESDVSSLNSREIVTAEDPDLNPGELTFDEGVLQCLDSSCANHSRDAADTAGGMGRHLGVFTCTLLM